MCKSVIPLSVDHYSYKYTIGNVYMLTTSHSNVITIPCLFDFVPILCGLRLWSPQDAPKMYFFAIRGLVSYSFGGLTNVEYVGL